MCRFLDGPVNVYTDNVFGIEDPVEVKMKKFVAVATLAAAAFSVTGCAALTASSPHISDQQVDEARALFVGSSGATVAQETRTECNWIERLRSGSYWEFTSTGADAHCSGPDTSAVTFTLDAHPENPPVYLRDMATALAEGGVAVNEPGVTNYFGEVDYVNPEPSIYAITGVYAFADGEKANVRCEANNSVNDFVPEDGVPPTAVDCQIQLTK